MFLNVRPAPMRVVSVESSARVHFVAFSANWGAAEHRFQQETPLHPNRRPSSFGCAGFRARDSAALLPLSPSLPALPALPPLPPPEQDP
jgi:hypothetical protein